MVVGLEEIILLSGVVLFCYGFISLVMVAFKINIKWGLALIIFPLSVFYFIVRYWNIFIREKLAFFVGIILLITAADMHGYIKLPQPVRDAPKTALHWVEKLLTPERYDADQYSSAPYRAHKEISKPNAQFVCDGRQHCSQMRSRAEAEFFLRNCPNTKMDGDNDGIPCENDSRF